MDNLYTFILNIKNNHVDSYNILLKLLADELSKHIHHIDILKQCGFEPSGSHCLYFEIPSYGSAFKIIDDYIYVNPRVDINEQNIEDILLSFKQSYVRKLKIEEICK
jgi:hypothetical protein